LKRKYFYFFFLEQSIAKLILQIDNKELYIPKHINPISKKSEALLRSMLVVDYKKRVDWNNLFFKFTELTDLQIYAKEINPKNISSENNSANLLPPP